MIIFCDCPAPLTFEEVEDLFIEHIMPYVYEEYEKDCIPDWPARREAWNDYTDSLCKDGEITEEDYNNWDQPSICGD